jgi:glycosyltransferase involved in cell wall biosynthesis
VGDVQPHFQQSRVMVVPLRSGSGMRVKILDAFARGVPVVSTRIGIEGIAAIDNQHLLIADSAEEFAAATVRVLEDRALAERLSRAARELVLTEYDVAIVARRMLDAVDSLSRNRAHDPRNRAGCSSSTAVEFANR